jgi:hypothetical protein
MITSKLFVEALLSKRTLEFIGAGAKSQDIVEASTIRTRILAPPHFVPADPGRIGFTDLRSVRPGAGRARAKPIRERACGDPRRRNARGEEPR